MMWERKGLIFCPDNEKSWCISHASNPHVIYLGGDIYRVFFSCRNRENRSIITSIDIDIVSRCITDKTLEPLIVPGSPGLFDDCGCFIGDVLRVKGNLYLYYQGWNLALLAPQNNYIGLAVSTDTGKSFEKHSLVPVIDRTEQNPFSLNAPAVLYKNGRFRMWYGSNISWGAKGNSLNIVIRTADSIDGIQWNTSDAVCIGPKDESEYSFAVSTVIFEAGLYKMFYSYRGTQYQIGYAESQDGLIWTRLDGQIQFTSPPEDWESDMVEYPAVFRHKGQSYMLYCGNGYGKTGFGLAKLLEDSKV